MATVYERIPVARPADSNFGPVRAREPRQVAEMRRMRRGGASMDDVAAAYGVSKRTAYRYLAAGITEHVVDVAGWRATFAIAPHEAPWRISRWTRG